MPSIYRLRPANDFLLSELENSYLWFSKPTAYNDTQDANVTSFVTNNSSISESFDNIYKNSKEILQKSKHIGICCFTEELPPFDIWKHFPSGKNGVFIEYDKEILENHFISQYGLGDCFKKAQYYNEPTIFQTTDDNNHLLWNIDQDGGLWYKPLAEIEIDERLRDELFLKMFTRISNRFESQNESRIILGGHNITKYNNLVKGYKIPIPNESILAIYLHPTTPASIKEELIKKYGEKINVDKQQV